MVQKISYVDDIDGTGNAATVKFGLGGQEYEIDLALRNRQRFLKMIGVYTAHARKATGALNGRGSSAATGRGSGPHHIRSAASRKISQQIRAWAATPAGRAATAGIKLSDRGRIPVEIVAAYEARNGAQSPAAAPAVFNPPAASENPPAGRSGPRNGNAGNPVRRARRTGQA